MNTFFVNYNPASSCQMLGLRARNSQPIRPIQHARVPIEIALPVDIRNMIYKLLAPIDQFKVNLFWDLRRIFNPDDNYSIDIDDNIEFAMYVYMYNIAGLTDKIFHIVNKKYNNSPDQYGISFRKLLFNPFAIYEDIDTYFVFPINICNSISSYYSNNYNRYLDICFIDCYMLFIKIFLLDIGKAKI